MRGTLHRLSARFVETVKDPGRHADGGNLYLNVTKTGARSFVFMYRAEKGRQRELGLGSARVVSLKDARQKAADLREKLAAGVDPLDQKASKSGAVTFGQVADQYIEANAQDWRNAKHRQQWVMTLEKYATTIRDKAVNEITTNDIYELLLPLWSVKHETASRLRGRIEAVLSAAKARGLRDGDNPAAWRGNLAELLPKRKRLTRGHHRAMPYPQVPDFLYQLKKLSSVSARALEFAIATAARSGEVIGARWSEIDIDSAVWTVPAGRMKSKVEHRKPLSQHAITIVNAMQAVRHSDFVFPGGHEGRPMSSMALEMVLRRMKADATPHGFRSSFRDWCAEETDFPNHVAEMALAHTVASEVERAYRRGDLFGKRRELMDAWSAFCLGRVPAAQAPDSSC